MTTSSTKATQHPIEYIVQQVRAFLSQVTDPVLEKPLLDAGSLENIQIVNKAVDLRLKVPYLQQSDYATLKSYILTQIAACLPQFGAYTFTVSIVPRIRSHQVQGSLKPHPKAKNIIAVASGKGGVGKSTVALNLALGLKALGAKVALLDADIYGPSQPKMLGKSHSRVETTEDKKFIPIESFGLETISMGYLVDEQTPMIWRGPMVSQALQQLLNETDWTPCDYLILDLPPGTGDIQLTMAQKIPLAGAVIVTTPQDIALLDVKKAYRMFEKLEVPVLGVIENMSTFTCTHCNHTHAIFGEGGGARLAEEFGLQLLAQLPLSADIRSESDAGRPLVAPNDASPTSILFQICAEKVSQALAQRKLDYSAPIQNIKITS